MQSTLHVVIGRQGAGKSTATRAIAATASAHGRTVATMEMADALKDAASAIFGFDRELLRNETDEARAFVQRPHPFWEQALGRPGFTPRVALQEVGLALRTTVGPAVWSHGTASRAVALLSTTCTDVVVSGVRYPDEVSLLAAQAAAQGHRVVLYCVQRPSQPPLDPSAAPECERVVEEAQRRAMVLGEPGGDTVSIGGRVSAHVIINPEEPDAPGRSIAAAVARIATI